MKIQQVQISNFRNTPNGTWQFDGHNVMLMGDNTVGKSNFIKALHMLLNAKFGKNNIREGEHVAEIKATIAEFNDWTPVEGTQHEFRARIRKKADGSEDVKIELRYPNGGVETTLNGIRSFVGAAPLQYNVVELTRTEKGKQQFYDIIVSMWPEDMRNELRLLDGRVDSAYNERTNVGRDLKAVEGFIESSGLSEEDLKTYTSAVDTSALRTQLEKASAHNERRLGVEKRITERHERAMAIGKEIDEIEAQIKALEEKKQKLRIEGSDLITKNDEAVHWMNDSKNAAIDTAGINAQLTAADEHNQKYERVNMLRGKLNDRNEMRERYGELTSFIDSTRDMIRQFIVEAPSPVPGLTIDPETRQIRYHGLPVDEEHMSTAQIMMLEAMLMMCTAKNVNVIFIERAESIGLKLMNELKELADGSGFQMFMEKVVAGQEELIVQIEAE